MILRRGRRTHAGANSAKKRTCSVQDGERGLKPVQLQAALNGLRLGRSGRWHPRQTSIKTSSALFLFTGEPAQNNLCRMASAVRAPIESGDAPGMRGRISRPQFIRLRFYPQVGWASAAVGPCNRSSKRRRRVALRLLFPLAYAVSSGDSMRGRPWRWVGFDRGGQVFGPPRRHESVHERGARNMGGRGGRGSPSRSRGGGRGVHGPLNLSHGKRKVPCWGVYSGGLL